MSEKRDKWNSAYQNADIAAAIPAQVLSTNDFLLPQSGRALDVACGRGGNALFLARLENRHFEVDAIDFSLPVLEKLSRYAKQNKLAIRCIERNVEQDGLIPDKLYDVITASYFLCRPLFTDLVRALNPGGLLFYQTWSGLSVDEGGPSNPAFRLAEGELLTLCAGLQPVFYRENGLLGDTKAGLRNEAMIIARKPV